MRTQQQEIKNMSGYTNDQTAEIRRLNDELRIDGGVEAQNGLCVCTPGVQGGGAPFVAAALAAVASFDAFTPDNDPYNEHDFGKVEVQGEALYFKIDYYNLTLDGHSADPTDAAVTKRVLTIMLVNEY